MELGYLFEGFYPQKTTVGRQKLRVFLVMEKESVFAPFLDPHPLKSGSGNQFPFHDKELGYLFEGFYPQKKNALDQIDFIC